MAPVRGRNTAQLCGYIHLLIAVVTDLGNGVAYCSWVRCSASASANALPRLTSVPTEIPAMMAAAFCLEQIGSPGRMASAAGGGQQVIHRGGADLVVGIGDATLRTWGKRSKDRTQQQPG